MKLQHKVAVVTGGAAGMGRSISHELARHGARVLVVDRDEEAGRQTTAELTALGHTVSFFAADVSLEAGTRSMIARAVETFGRLDVLVNNVGLLFGANFDEVGEEDWQPVLDTNLKSVVFGCQHAVRQMLEDGGGSIVNIASISGIQGHGQLVLYGAAKAGVVHLTRSLALAYGPHGIRVNCVSPGAIDTRMLRAAFDGSPATEPLHKYLRHTIPLNRFGDPREIARAVLFLASEDASYITGHNLVVDGGLTAGSLSDSERILRLCQDVVA